MPQIRLNIPDELLLRAEQSRPQYLGQSAFLCLLLDKALDTCSTLGPEPAEGPSKAVTSKAVTSKSISSIHKHYINIENSIDDTLTFVRPQLLEWWQIRREHHKSRAIGTERAWKASHDALLSILRTHGPAVVTATVNEALASAWRGIRESYAVLPGRATAAQRAEAASAAHPAYEVRY